MAKNIIYNNNPQTTKNTQVNISNNIQPKKNLGRGGLYGVDTAHNWFGGIVDTLTGFGVLRFFLLCMLFLVFLRALFSATGQVPETLTLTGLFNLLSQISYTDTSWVDVVEVWFNKTVIPVGGVTWAKIADIFSLLFKPIKLLLYMADALFKLLHVLNTIISWFILK